MSLRCRMPALSWGLMARPCCAVKPTPFGSNRAFSSSVKTLRSQFILRASKGATDTPAISVQGSRSFSSALRFYATIKPQKSPIKTPIIKPKKVALPATKSIAELMKIKLEPKISYADTFAQKNAETLLYQAPSHSSFIISCYTGGLFCILYAGFSLSTKYTAPEGLAWWVPITYGSISVFMAAFGCYLMAGPARLVHRITAIPRQMNVLASVMSAETRSASNLHIEVLLRPILPFVRAKRVYAQPQNINLPHQLCPPEVRMSPRETRLKAAQEAEAKAREFAYDRSHILTSPFRHASQAIHGFLQSIGRSWHRGGFAKLGVNGYVYKLDVTGGWALDKGKALDHLITIKKRVPR